MNNEVDAFPAYAPVDRWCALSGMGRSATYQALGRGNLRAIKVGARTLIDVPNGLGWLRSLPTAKIRPYGTNRSNRTV